MILQITLEKLILPQSIEDCGLRSMTIDLSLPAPICPYYRKLYKGIINIPHIPIHTEH